MCVVCVYTCMYFIYTSIHTHICIHIYVYILYISLFFSFYGDFRYEEILRASKDFSLVLIKYFMSFKDFVLK